MGRGKASNKSGAPGTDGVKAAWDKAAKGSGGDTEKKPAKARHGEQMRIKVDSRDAVHVPAKHELRREMTHTEWEEQSALLAKNRVELMGIEDEIRRLKEKHAPRTKELRGLIDNGARQCDAREWLTMAECIEVHDVNRRTVTVYADLGNGELGAEVIPPRKMRDDEYERAIKSSPFEPPEVLEPPTGEPLDIEEGPADEPAGEPAGDA